ncbi:MAG: methyltransferase domain-containing protein [Ahniella sp.]|nr:methyltransferase domain-containing protein [Ahniella sp.]
MRESGCRVPEGTPRQSGDACLEGRLFPRCRSVLTRHGAGLGIAATGCHPFLLWGHGNRHQQCSVGDWPLRPVPARALAEIPEDLQKAYCELVGSDSFAINETLRKRVGFALFNIMDVARAPLKKLDLIYCQNVLIYFARDRRKQLLSALADLLKPGGMLVLGAGEVIGFTHPSLTRIGNRQTLAFRRSG